MSEEAPHLTIIADDLTGAADCAARAARAGLSSAIMLDTDQFAAGSVDVASITTDSRHLSAEQAAQRVTEIIGRLTASRAPAARGEASWYKKIDSTLRGHIGVELAAMLDALADPLLAAVVCPAFPAQGRGLAGGHLVHGGAAARTPHLPRLLESQTGLSVAAVGLATVRGGAGKLTTALNRARRNGARFLVVDAVSDEDVAGVVAAAQSAGMLLCGSAGMVGALAARLVRGRRPTAVGPSTLPDGPVLAVVGSGSPMAHRQIAQVAASEDVRVRAMAGSWVSVDLIGVQSKPVGDWLIHLPTPDAGTPLEGPVARAAAANLADLAHSVVQRLQPGALVVVGGDTAHFVLRGLGIRRLDVLEELEPGIALSMAIDREGVQRAVILKPGSFGDEDTLLTLMRLLRSRMAAAAAFQAD